MNVWIVNPFDSLPGETFKGGRYGFLARFLANKGHAVVWWSSDFSHVFKKRRDISRIRTPLGKGIIIKLLQTPPYKHNVSIQRIINHRVYAKQFAKKAISLKPSPDVIIASCPPLDSAWASIKVAHTLGAKVIIDIQDLWPEAFQIILPSKVRFVAKWIFYALKRRETQIFQQSDAISAISQDYLERALAVIKSKKPTRVIHLGIDLRAFDRATSHGILPFEKKKGEFWVIYTGSISRNYDIETMVRVADLARQKGLRQMRFLFTGGGAMLPVLKGLQEKLGLENTRFLEWLRYEDMIQVLLHADIAVNAVRPETNIFFPRKVFGYFAAGLPIINSMNGGELDKLIKEKDVGIPYIAKDAKSLFAAITELYYDESKLKHMGANSRRLAENVFDQRVAYHSFVELINQVAAP